MRITVTAALIVALTGAPAHAGGKPVSATGKACTVVGTVGNDRLFGTHGYDVICGLGGNDVIKGGGGRDVVDGGPGDDDLDGENGADTVIGGAGNDRVKGGAGNDQAKGGDDTDIVDGGTGTDLVDGGPGDDTVGGGATELDPVSGGDRVIGGPGADTLDGGPGADTLAGDEGDDIVNGGDGNDVAGGDEGDDTLSGDEGSDRLDGGEGTDHLEGGGGSDGVNGGAGNDTVGGGAGDDTLRGGAGNDIAAGGDGSDKLAGGPGDDQLDGGTGNDVASGGDGIDALVGGDGDDQLDGGGGDDVIQGGDGTDQLIGGDGADDMNGGNGDDGMDGGIGDDRMDGGGGNDDVEGGPGLNACVPDPDDAGGDKCTDKAIPLIDLASLKWEIEPSVENSKEQTIKLSGHLTDDRSGIVYGSVQLRNPDESGPSLNLWTWEGPATGHTHDGTFVMSGPLPALSRSGEWTVASIYLTDRVHRWTIYNVTPEGAATVQGSITPENSDAGTVTLAPLTVTGEYDAAPPLADLTGTEWRTARELDNAEDRTATLRLTVTDDLAGVNSVGISLTRVTEPNGPSANLGNSELKDGTVNDGVWDVTGTVPARLPAGEWRVQAITLWDKANRYRSLYRPDDAQDGVDWPATLTIIGDEASDLEKPSITMSGATMIGPSSGDNSVDRAVRIKIDAEDDKSGIIGFSAHIRTDGAESWLGSAGGDEENGWELAGTLPATTTPGEWWIDSIMVQDRVGRYRYYTIAADGSYTTDDGQTGQSDLPKYTLTPIGG
ncbi:calcium-binding protein [Actinoplanes sp. CA-252034]|uniref:calcium-binding protein n=1 Tax=Actinoplanes sp. CA-252034 TaxID=3239906 RepID=UPI003D979B15